MTTENEIFSIEPGLRSIVDLIRVECGSGVFTAPYEDDDEHRPGGWAWEQPDGRTIEIELYESLDDSVTICTYDWRDLDDGPLFTDQEVYPTLAIATATAKWWRDAR